MDVTVAQVPGAPLRSARERIQNPNDVAQLISFSVGTAYRRPSLGTRTDLAGTVSVPTRTRSDHASTQTDLAGIRTNLAGTRTDLVGIAFRRAAARKAGSPPPPPVPGPRPSVST